MLQLLFDYPCLTEIQVYGKRSHNEGVTDCRKESWKEVNGDHGSKIICCNWSRMALPKEIGLMHLWMKKDLCTYNVKSK